MRLLLKKDTNKFVSNKLIRIFVESKTNAGDDRISSFFYGTIVQSYQ